VPTHMAEPGTPKPSSRVGAALSVLAGASLLTLYGYNIFENEIHTFLSLVTENDLSTTVEITREETMLGYGRGPATTKFSTGGGHLFTAMVDGHEERFFVSKEDAEKYEVGQKVEVTYDKHTWRGGSTTVTDVNIKH
jgi:hypothetical protein